MKTESSDKAAHDLAEHIIAFVRALHAHSDAGTIAAALILALLDLFALSGGDTPADARRKLVSFILGFKHAGETK